MRRLLLTILATGAFLSLLPVVPAMAATLDPFQEACDNVPEGAERPAACDTSDKDPITGREGDGVLIKATNIVAFVTGVAAVITIIIAGLQYITAAGDPNKIGGAKQTIIFALVGIAIVMVARGVITFIVRRL